MERAANISRSLVYWWAGDRSGTVGNVNVRGENKDSGTCLSNGNKRHLGITINHLPPGEWCQNSHYFS